MPRARRRPPPRRTQEQRRTATIGKLLDAATAALIDVGYASATVQEICARAGVSQGALFRHFPTREALMVAAGEDVGRRILVDYRRELEALRGSKEPLIVAMNLVRDHCRSRVNQAWFELGVAARTNPNLKKALRPVGARYQADIEALARELTPDLATKLGPRFAVLVDTLVAVFNGEVVQRLIVAQPAVEAARLELLAGLARLLLVSGP